MVRAWAPTPRTTTKTPIPSGSREPAQRCTSRAAASISKANEATTKGPFRYDPDMISWATTKKYDKQKPAATIRATGDSRHDSIVSGEIEAKRISRSEPADRCRSDRHSRTIVVPAPGEEAISASPPTRRTASMIELRTPKRSRATREGSKPHPSSATTIRRPPASPRIESVSEE